jgi:chromosome segregation ATPase
MPLALALAFAAIAAVAYSQYSQKSALEARFEALQDQIQQQLNQNLKKTQAATTDLASDLDVVRKHIGVTAQELVESRKYAEKLKQEQERSKQELASQLATKANANDVSRDVAAAREEASTKVAAVAKDADAKITNVSGDVKTVDAKLEATKTDLAASRREIVDVKTTLSQQIARNSGELADLRKKGERDFFEFDIKKGKKGQMQRVGDIQVELRDTDQKKQKYGVLIQVDDSKLEKKDRTANEPVQFLVGRDKLRYELVVNFIDKDRIRGYLSAPKDKVLAAERPQLR